MVLRRLKRTHCFHMAWRRQDRKGLTHCLRAWFRRLKYRISFFRIAWFLESTDKGQKWQLSACPQSDESPQSPSFSPSVPPGPTLASLHHPCPA